MIDDSPLRRGRQTERTACALKTWPMARSWGRPSWRRRKRNLSVSAAFKFVFGLDCKYLRIILPNNKSSVMKSVSSILSLVALKSMATGSGKVWGAKLSPKVQRKRVKSKVALLKVKKKKLLVFDIVFLAGLPQWTGKSARVWGILRVAADFWSLPRKEVRRGVWRRKPNCWQV